MSPLNESANICLNISLTLNKTSYSFCPQTSLFRLNFAINVFIVGIITLFGIVGNIISIMVLKKDWKRSSTNVLLCTLSLYDLSFLILSVYYITVVRGLGLYFSQINASLEILLYNRYLIPLTWYFGNVSRYGRNWIAVAVAIDRYIMVRNPFLVHGRNTSTRAKIISVAIALTTFLYNIPRLFDYAAIWDVYSCRYILRRNTQKTKFHFIGYDFVLFSVIIIIGPIILLIIFNTLLTLSLIKAHNVRQGLMVKQANAKTSSQMETRMLIIVIGVFIITELPSCILQDIISVQEILKIGPSCLIYKVFVPIFDCLAILNSSVNFLIYSLCGQRFRDNFYKMFCKSHFQTDLQNRQRHFQTTTTMVSVKKKNNIIIEQAPRGKN